MSDIPISTYAKGLRELVNASFPSGLPVVEEFEAVGGTLARRLKAYARSEAGEERKRVHFRPHPQGDPQPTLVPAREYFVLATRAAAFPLGPLLEIADAEFTEQDARSEAEAELLDELDRLGWLITPPPILRVLHGLEGADRQAVSWLDVVWAELLRISSDDDVRERRSELRVDAMRAGSRGVWSDVATCSVELVVDYMYLSRICMIEAARAPGEVSGDATIASALRELDERQDLLFESHLVFALDPNEIRKKIPPHELSWLRQYQDARASRGLIAPHLLGAELACEPRTQRVPRGQQTRLEMPTTVVRRGEGSDETSDTESSGLDLGDPHDLYQSLLSALRRRIIGEDALVQELSLIGVEHLHREDSERAARVLIAGASGTGKTHASRSLIQVLREVVGEQIRSYELYCPDLSATGWRGLDVGDVIEELRAMRGTISVLLMQEVDKLAVLGGENVDGNSKESKANVQASLLGLTEGSAVRADDGLEHRTDDLLLVGTGAFGNRFTSPPTDKDLIDWGFSAEIASRWTRRLCCSGAVNGEGYFDLVKHTAEHNLQSPRLAAVFGVSVEFSGPALHYLAGQLARTGENYRTTIGRLEQAVRRRLLARLDSRDESDERLVIVPDDLSLD